MRNLVILVLFFTAAPVAFASGVHSEARLYTFYCGYFSDVYADAKLEYVNDTLPWGVKVDLIAGLEGKEVKGGGENWREERFEWSKRMEKVLAATAPYTWSAVLPIHVAHRSQPTYVDGLNFVYRITYPDGRVAYDNGTQSPWGFYRISFSKLRSGCIDSLGYGRPEFEAVDTQTVSRH